MSSTFRKIRKKGIIRIIDYIDYAEGGIISRAVVQRDDFSFTFFSFAEGEEISEYIMDGDVIIHLLEGEIEVRLKNEESHFLKQGDLIAVPDKIPHSIYASEASKAAFYILKSD